MNMVHAVPPVTKFCVLSYLLVFALVHCHIVTGPMLSFVPSKIMQGELWRLLTGFLYLGQSDMSAVLSVIFFYVSSHSLESLHYATSKAYFKRLLSLAVMVLVACLVCGIRTPSMPFLAAIDCLIQTRQDGHFRRITLIPVPEVLQPFQRIIMSAAFGDMNDALAQLVGLVLGHVLFIVEDVWSVWS